VLHTDRANVVKSAVPSNFAIAAVVLAAQGVFGAEELRRTVPLG
jgi:hypothetical protein